MKKIICLIMALIMILSLGTGCTSKQEAPSSTGTTTTEQTNTEKKDPIVIKYGHICAEDHSVQLSALKFKEYVEKESNGEIKVELYPNGILGGDVQMTEAVAMGTLQMALPSTSVLVMYSPQFGALDMPFMFTNTEKAFEGLNGGPIGEKLDAELEKVGIVNLGYNFNGMRSMTNNVKPINEPADLAGIKMRVMESPVFIDMFKYLGSNATPMSFSELFTGLQQKTVDGQENPASLIYASKFQEVQKYLSLTEHVYSFCANLMNQDFYDSLTDDQKKIVNEGAKQFLVDWQINSEVNDNQKFIDKLKEAGMEVNEVSAENKQKFVEKVAPMYVQYEKELGAEIFDIIEPYRQ
ncbi:MAG: tripartite ATP-independent periplasmic transporter solute receptor, DctP family [Bacillota bacterium]|jgi:tripartite ATP-independent transporter DctP family solute receptor|nr:tripartite ATP-independent periplasmic transporter solute receptor, DctP family [Bacillota bacterium]